LRFAKSYGDHMVLQRGPQRAVIWGFADKNGETITAQIVGHGGPVTNKTANGQWKLKLPAMTAEGPFTIEVSSHSEGKLTLHDVLFGDVWICSGQSNMGYQFGAVNNSAYELQKALKFTKVRIFHVQDVESPTPLTDIKKVQTPWTVPTTSKIFTLYTFSAVCFLFGEYVNTHRKYPIGLIESAWGGTPIEAWTSPGALAKCPVKTGKRNPHSHSVLWNAMINPLLAMTIYGAIWYQGESNSGHPERYVCQQPAMVNDWRQQFHHGSLGETSDKFPFGVVQLAANKHDFNRIGGFPGLRFSQTGNVGYVPNTKLPHTFMAVAMDLPDFNSPRGTIHPRFKQDVGERLGLASLAVAYGQKGLNYQGPFPTSFNNHSGTVFFIRTIHKNRASFKICCSTSKTDCGSNDQWVAAPITHHQGASVTLNTSGCHGKHMVGLRYAWRESPCLFKKCAIYGRDNDLPGPSFIRNKAF
ncbi:hypothetical protein LOTGIDRAFT_133687, partial [Lottia gigantea]